ncbi:TRAP transporter substrate-binding protein [Tropicimonas isoalkanivorans]|uniref:TRAP-type mannitol/chloroaromatic compound transport system, substrate-binding protein n=1 Tax=Tropicimonas isoalkanivorans TaxID=441112 RepID=A0A1I1K0E7_9RHOB|nr:TRAP transporter substrate-binding protein [Tropicimonas isoalkanivorans]SFC54284.1 TRAP-type mannitol/chloroaromatic compound transport system, substrate-binding protein [Tropicimonas isoalkanivorans]
MGRSVTRRAFAGLCGLAATAITATAIAPTPAMAQAEYQWTFQTSETAGEPQFKLKEKWAENVKKMSGGRIEITILPIGAVVPHNQTLDAVGAGILQGHLTDPSYFSGKDPAFGMIGNLVGAWGDPLEFVEFLKHGGGEEIYAKLVEPYGLHLIGGAATGVEALVSSKPIRTVDDLKGLKVRAPEGMVYDIFTKAGATPVNLPGSEVYTSLEKGVIDAADYTVFATNHAQGMHEFANYPSYPGFHSAPMIDISINKQLWDSLSEDLQAILDTSIDAFAFDTLFELKKLDLAAVEEANADPNIEIIDLPAEERAKFRNIAREEWKTWADKNEITAEYYEAVTEFLTSRGLM